MHSSYCKGVWLGTNDIDIHIFIQGSHGAPGTKGTQGLIGDQGIKGPNGSPGRPGETVRRKVANTIIKMCHAIMIEIQVIINTNNYLRIITAYNRTPP